MAKGMGFLHNIVFSVAQSVGPGVLFVPHISPRQDFIVFVVFHACSPKAQVFVISYRL